MERVLIYGMTDNTGGIETYLLNLTRRMQGQLAFDFVSDFTSIAYQEELQKLGSRFFYIPPKGRHLFQHWRQLWSILRQHPEYRTVYFNILDAGCAFTEFIPWLLGRKIVTHSHNSDTEKKRLHRICRPFLNIFTREYVACSQVAAEYMFGPSKKARIIPNTIDVQKFVFDPESRRQVRQELKAGDAPVLCHVGRLSPQKNPIGMLDIFQEVLNKCPEAILVSVGTGEMDEEVHAYAKRIGVAEHVRFLGKRNDVSRILQGADVFFLPSLYEGFGIVIVEAQAAGLHCVVSTSVPKETNLTGNVRFLSLEEPYALWADVLLQEAAKERTDTSEAVRAHGYDNQHCEQTDAQLLAILR